MANASPLAYHPAAFGMEEEFLEELRKKSVREGEEGLMLAILEDAIACFRKYVHARDGREKALFRDAEEWILERESEWIFSFENICDTLGINASYLRQGLIQWKEKELGPRQAITSRNILQDPPIRLAPIGRAVCRGASRCWPAAPSRPALRQKRPPSRSPRGQTPRPTRCSC